MSVGDVSRETRGRRLAVVGTGTGVGKTHAATALVAALARRGLEVAGLKPVESGVADGSLSDAERLAGVSNFVPGQGPYRLADPVSPHLAARREGRVISLEVIAAWVDEQRAGFSVIETAGAVLSPIGPGLTNLDLVRALAPEALLLVGLDRLGILHEVACCTLVLKTLAPELPAPIVLLNPPELPDASTGTNAEELNALDIARGAMTMPRARPEDAGSHAVAELVAARLGWPGR